MDNVYQIKKRKCLDFILPKEEKLSEIDRSVYESIIVVVHIYYYERIQFYLKFIENIPVDIFLLITVSEKATGDLLISHLNRPAEKYKILIKENRGRDISALLVAARPYILKYKYVCFLHDKKEKAAWKKKDVEQWNHCLWENSIGSKCFIDNVIYMFEKNRQIGLLVPPSPVTENIGYGYRNPWGEDFILTQELAKQMNLKSNLQNTFPPITLGTMFWAKTDALKGLLYRDWKYEDFEQEPLAEDGTISHAIERILPFVAQDAGYDTGWVMTDRYAAEQFEYHIDVLNMVFRFFERIHKVTHISGVRKLLGITEKIYGFCEKFQKLYIYGAGEVGKQCFGLISGKGVRIDAFLVTTKKDNSNTLYGNPVEAIGNVGLDENCGIIIAVSDVFINEILEELLSRGILRENIFIFGQGAQSGDMENEAQIKVEKK